MSPVTEKPAGERTESRVGASIIVIAIVALIALLPRRYALTPSWFAYVTVTLLIAPMLLVMLLKGRGVWIKVERGLEIFAVSVALAANCGNLIVASYNLVENPSILEPQPLFYTAIGIWVGNVLIFTILYWLIDRGGADARLNHTVQYPDFVFPAMEDDVNAPPDWLPHIADYFFLAFTTSTAFSPTEAMPMTVRAKMLMVLQSTLALITIALVAARTINILQ